MTVYMGRALLTLALGLAAPQALAGSAGKVAGKVLDRDSGEPLVAANVTLVGTRHGASASENGDFFVLDVPAGSYDIRVDYIGYKSSVVQGVKISSGLTTRVEIALKATMLDVGAITATVAAKELARPGITSSFRETSGEEICEAPLRGYQESVAVNAGIVVDAHGGHHLRGGRSNEVAFYVDGVFQNDLFSGGNNIDVMLGSIDEISVESGGFSAEYGHAMSGVVNVITKSGREAWSGRVETASDVLAGGWANTMSFGYKLVNGSIGGPLLPNGKLAFFGSVELQHEEDNDPSPVSVRDNDLLGHNDAQKINGAAKLTYRPTEDFSLEASYLRSQRDQNDYALASRFGSQGDAWRHNLEHAPRTEDCTANFALQGTLLIGEATLVESQVSFFSADFQRGDGVYFDDLKAYLGNDRGEDGERLDATGSFFEKGAAFDDYLHRDSQYVGFRADVVHQATDVFADGLDHELKTGIEYQKHSLRNYHNASPTAGNVDVDAYGYTLDHQAYDGAEVFDSSSSLSAPKEPRLFACYIQDKMEFADLVINVGLRFDYLDSQTDIFKRLSNVPQPGVAIPLAGDDRQLTADDFISSEASTQVSPRVAIGFPVGETTHLHLNWGCFSQAPNLSDLYSGLAWYNTAAVAGGLAGQVGNPSLEAQRTTAYEVGVKHEFSEGVAMDAVAFYRDTDGLINLAYQDADPARFFAPFNVDEATSKGVEVGVEMLRRNHVRVKGRYTLCFATGTGSAGRSLFNEQGAGFEAAGPANPLDFDQRHTFLATVDIGYGEGEGVGLFGLRPLQNGGVAFIARMGSGLAYTPTSVYNTAVLDSVPSYEPTAASNSSSRPGNFRMDMKASKRFMTAGGYASLYLEVLNLFNRENPLNVYSATGSAQDDGYLGTAAAAAQAAELGLGEDEFNALYRDRLSDPFLFDVPRLFRLGLVLGF